MDLLPRHQRAGTPSTPVSGGKEKVEACPLPQSMHSVNTAMVKLLVHSHSPQMDHILFHFTCVSALSFPTQEQRGRGVREGERVDHIGNCAVPSCAFQDSWKKGNNKILKCKQTVLKCEAKRLNNDSVCNRRLVITIQMGKLISLAHPLPDPKSRIRRESEGVSDASAGLRSRRSGSGTPRLRFPPRKRPRASAESWRCFYWLKAKGLPSYFQLLPHFTDVDDRRLAHRGGMFMHWSSCCSLGLLSRILPSDK